jgi:glutamine synthetase
MLDAIRNFSKNRTFREAFGDEFCSAYVKLKTNEWNQYCRHLTQWERDTTLDC